MSIHPLQHDILHFVVRELELIKTTKVIQVFILISEPHSSTPRARSTHHVNVDDGRDV